MKKKISPLSYKLLSKKLNFTQLDFETTADLKPLTEFVGQERALEAIYFGIGIKSKGYNIYAMGPSGVGKRALIRRVLETKASTEPVPPDWCYIHNFEIPEKPIAISLPPGQGTILQQDLKNMVNEFSTSILGMFESDEYNQAMDDINSVFNKKRRKISKKNHINVKTGKVPQLYKEKHQQETEIQEKMTSGVVKPIINKLKKKYTELPDVIKYLNDLQNDIICNVNDFIKRDETTHVISFPMNNPSLIKYQINLIINNDNVKGAPIVFEDNPTCSNLICRIEHTTLQGNLMTNFTLIKSGSLHQANGGYLVIESRKIKKDKEAWETLKRALYTDKISIEPFEESADHVKPVSLAPMPIPLNVKVILLGERYIYYSFFNHDPDFDELFKVVADFDEQIERNKININLYSRLIGTITVNEKLRPFHANAVAAIIDYSARLAEDIEKLSTHIRSIIDIIIESDYWAGISNKKFVQAEDVAKAIKAQIHRLDRVQDLYNEEIYRHFVKINTKGKSIGQINCLSVVKIGKYSFGHPTRVTATVRLGKGKVIDIQREIKMAGPSFSKASLIISNFLASRYINDHSFSLHASLSFEQLYGKLDGDSASVGEVCALISALARVPLKQNLAVTGSLDQYGLVQSIGGVNEKIEGFYDICKLRGLGGKNGVIIPKINIKNLMLREDIVEAAREKKFFIYTIETIDEAISLLTGVKAGKRKKGQYEKNSVNYKVENRLKQFTKSYMLERKNIYK